MRLLKDLWVCCKFCTRSSLRVNFSNTELEIFLITSFFKHSGSETHRKLVNAGHVVLSKSKKKGTKESLKEFLWPWKKIWQHGITIFFQIIQEPRFLTGPGENWWLLWYTGSSASRLRKGHLKFDLLFVSKIRVAFHCLLTRKRFTR